MAKCPRAPGWTRLIAPQAGVITAVSASAGQVVSDGQSVLTLATGKPATWRLILPRPMRSRLWIRRFCRFPCSATRRCRRLPHCGYHPAGRSSDPHVARQGHPAKPAGGHGAGRQRHRDVALRRPARVRASRVGADPRRRQTGRFCDYPAVAGAAARWCPSAIRPPPS
jgi:multidrug efflux pump subunit AcrA (membrane-fusion protein)